MRYLKDFIHNAVIHPAMMLLTVKSATRLHDWSVRRLRIGDNH